MNTVGPLTTQINPAAVGELLIDALRLATPAWPLQNAVAVNPFWNLRSTPFTETMRDTSRQVGHNLYMPLTWYLERFRRGQISPTALGITLDELRKQRPSVPPDVETLLRLSAPDDDTGKQTVPTARTFADFVDTYGTGPASTAWAGLFRDEVSRYCAAYFDENQSLTRFPWNTQGFLEAWWRARQLDRSLEYAGLRGARDVFTRLHTLTPEGIVRKTLTTLGISDDDRARTYLRSLVAAHLGWASQFKLAEWQRDLGLPAATQVQAADLLAVRCACELALFHHVEKIEAEVVERWQRSVAAAEPSADPTRGTLAEIWLRAAELTYAQSLAARLAPPGITVTPARYQAVFCIDVRSEMIRRHVEIHAPDFQTLGFAGFFGVPVEYQGAEERQAGRRCPVLLKPAQHMGARRRFHARWHVRDRQITTGYFRNLRKASMGSFGYVEFFGLLSLGKIASRIFGARRTRTEPDSAAYAATGFEPDLAEARNLDGSAFNLQHRVERAAWILTHMGLKSGFGRLVLICGHGSRTTNNAFASTLDCGACGGHPGDVNARILCALLNDADVRTGLRAHGIEIPTSTWFVAALHETVTDEILFLEADLVPADWHADLAEVRRIFRAAAEQTRAERAGARTKVPAPPPAVRARDWSEVRPEWGLAGNAAFIVAPRARTRGVGLSSRAFLHDYDWRTDTEFATLELIMTAPMLVTNWINMQYYASTVAPPVYGSGNKVLHNLVNENGVLEGNAGDLRLGLPLQSVHDGRDFTHEPLRLHVIIDAPIAAIEGIIQKHQVVRELVDNEWLLLSQLGADGLLRRAPGGTYT